MHLELGHQVYEPIDRFQPAVASTGVGTPARRSAIIKRTRSASNPPRSMERWVAQWLSGEYRGVLSAPGAGVICRNTGASIGEISTFVLSATVESPCIATSMSLPSGETVTSPSPPVAIAGTS